MGLEIIDGTGTGVSAKVNTRKELVTRARVISHLADQSKEGNSFVVSTDFIALTTTGSYSGIFHIKNSSTKILHVFRMRSCTTQVAQWKLTIDPTTGTLISAGTSATALNLNRQSATSAGVTIDIGADAKTITDGSLMAQWSNDIGHLTDEWDGSLILGVGDSLAMACKPTAACDACVTLTFTLEDE